MDLRLSVFNSPFRTILFAGKPHAEADDLTPLYHIYTAYGWKSEPTIISTISPSIAHDPTYKFTSEKATDVKEASEYEGGGDGFEEIGRIIWKSIGSNRLDFQGRVTKIDEFMPSGGFLWKNRTFTGPDGLSYTWHSGDRLTVEKRGETGETTEVIVARVCRRGPKWTFKTHLRDCLEIMEEGMHMVDWIVVTWAYIWTQIMIGRNAAAQSASAASSASAAAAAASV
ncbi:hypothetical protein BXZ70DRAFT_540060 [Cristinia sonorae]|uniref:DUF6593 domain-containing protein n=1 Tax=Cristinia sonorae TaxID=1940300 RepID=A0A8K0UHJ9_9AGAR|nr:hypothetical protein BXZ70DRAFT_540060 [Cristinia sonorae]